MSSHHYDRNLFHSRIYIKLSRCQGFLRQDRIPKVNLNQVVMKLLVRRQPQLSKHLDIHILNADNHKEITYKVIVVGKECHQLYLYLGIIHLVMA